jgi:hypothetical protein
VRKSKIDDLHYCVVAGRDALGSVVTDQRKNRKSQAKQRKGRTKSMAKMLRSKVFLRLDGRIRLL